MGCIMNIQQVTYRILSFLAIALGISALLILVMFAALQFGNFPKDDPVWIFITGAIVGFAAGIGVCSGECLRYAKRLLKRHGLWEQVVKP